MLQQISGYVGQIMKDRDNKASSCRWAALVFIAMIVWCLYETSGSTNAKQLAAYVDLVRIFVWGIAGALGFSQARSALNGAGIALTATQAKPPFVPPATATTATPGAAGATSGPTAATANDSPKPPKA